METCTVSFTLTDPPACPGQNLHDKLLHVQTIWIQFWHVWCVVKSDCMCVCALVRHSQVCLLQSELAMLAPLLHVL